MLNKFRIFETNEFQKKISKLDVQNQATISKKLRTYVYPQLRQEPFFGKNIKKLKGYSPSTWRYRVGQFRLFYGISYEENTVYMLTIDNRKDAYN